MEKKPTVYIMCGIPASGKSTWIHNWIFENQHDCRYVSRDEIRFALLKDGEDYFSHEQEVFRKFVDRLGEGLNKGLDVIADATHLNSKSREKLLHALHTYCTDFNTICVCLETPLEACLERNSARTGRAHVPEETLKDMHENLSWPQFGEDKSIKAIWMVRSDDE